MHPTVEKHTPAAPGATLSAWTSKDHESSCMVAVEETCLDVAFWQALGRALRWQGPVPPDFALHWELSEAEAREAIAHDLLVNGIPLWLDHWHRFVDGGSVSI